MTLFPYCTSILPFEVFFFSFRIFAQRSVTRFFPPRPTYRKSLDLSFSSVFEVRFFISALFFRYSKVILQAWGFLRSPSFLLAKIVPFCLSSPPPPPARFSPVFPPSPRSFPLPNDVSFRHVTAPLCSSLATFSWRYRFLPASPHCLVTHSKFTPFPSLDARVSFSWYRFSFSETLAFLSCF